MVNASLVFFRVFSGLLFLSVGLYVAYGSVISYCKYDDNREALPGILGNKGKRHLFQGNKGQLLGGSGIQKQYWGTGNTRTVSIFREQGIKPIYFRGTREQVPTFWEGLNRVGAYF